MPLYIKDETTTRLVNELAHQRGLSKQAAVRLAVQAELDRAAAAVPLRERLVRLWAEHPLPPPTGNAADKAFFDDLAGEP
jgi:antitoxin VapB